MTQRKSKRHLEFESLESMQLLSGAGAAVHHAMVHHHHHGAQVHRAPMGHVALNLSGTIQGTYRIVGGMSARFNGRGAVSPVGKVRLKGTIALTGNGQMVLNFGKRGKLFADVTSVSPTGSIATYRITGGTRSLAGDTGSGESIISFMALNGNHGGFNLALQPLPTT